MSLSTSSSRSSASLLMPSVSSRNSPISGWLLCERQLTEALQNGQSLTLEKKQWNHYNEFICISLLIIHYISAGTCFSLLDERVWLSLEGLTIWGWPVRLAGDQPGKFCSALAFFLKTCALKSEAGLACPHISVARVLISARRPTFFSKKEKKAWAGQPNLIYIKPSR